jgi:hypothetical protein
MIYEKYGKKTETDFDEAQYQFFIDEYPKLRARNCELEHKIITLKTKIDMLQSRLKFHEFIENERKREEL